MQVEDFEYLIEHFTVLRGDADDALDFGGFFQLLYQRCHFNRLGACPEHAHYLYFIHIFSPSLRPWGQNLEGFTLKLPQGE